jgi:serine/threonine protein kinase
MVVPEDESSELDPIFRIQLSESNKPTEHPGSVLTSKVTMFATETGTLNWTLGPYRIAREIGRGQFGTVYEAADAQGRQIALKLVPVQGPDSEQKVAAERQGAALQQRFSRTSDHLVPEVLDHQRIDPYYAIAMELVSGQPLTALIKSGRLSADRAATIAGAICRFLVEAHEFTADLDDRLRTILVHGDLKPAHILLLADGTVRVLDFGIAKALAARNAETTNLWSSVDYASPERLESGRVNEHVDLWSVGVILFEMLSGTRPYAHCEHNRSRLENAIRNQEPRLRVPSDVDPRLTAIVDKLLAPQIEHRYQSARQIAADLQAFLDRTPVLAFAEAARADQATVRTPTSADSYRSRASLATEPLPRPHPAAATPEAPRAEVLTVGEGRSPGAVVASPPEAAGPSPVVVSPQPTRPSPASQRSYKRWIAATLSFLAPGLGQIYNREYLRGIFWLIVTPGFWIGSGGALGWPFHLIAAYTAYRRACRPATPAAAAPITGTPMVLIDGRQ